MAPTDEGGDRDAHLAEAWMRIHTMLEPSVRIINLTRGFHLPEGVENRELGWPTELGDRERNVRPHQILRFIRGDEHIEDLIAGTDENPLMGWLRQDV